MLNTESSNPENYEKINLKLEIESKIEMIEFEIERIVEEYESFLNDGDGLLFDIEFEMLNDDKCIGDYTISNVISDIGDVLSDIRNLNADLESLSYDISSLKNDIDELISDID